MEYVIQRVDGVAFRMREKYDFGFLVRYGRVFKAFDNQDSGNICFGVEKDGRRYFVKFAGAPTVRGGVSQEVAVANLRATLPVYEELRHENLIELVRAEDVGGGFAMVFRWVDAICMGRMWGSSRFMSPEEFEMGAAIDEVTNVYTLGAMAFALFGNYQRGREAWTLSDVLYDVAARAVSGERERRQQSIGQFVREWAAAN